MAVSSPVLVGMAELYVRKGEGQFTCLGLGSCIGLAAVDPLTKVGGMVHIMLPEAFPDKPVDKPGKFADTGVRQFLADLESMGASKSRLRWAMAGGAQVFKFGDGSPNRMDIGARNALAVKQILSGIGARIVAQEVGGHEGRTMIMTLETGGVRVRSVSSGERDLCNLLA